MPTVETESAVVRQRADGLETTQSLFELDVAAGQVRWANPAALERLGYRLDQLADRAFLDLVPAAVREEFAGLLKGQRPLYFVLPLLMLDGRVAWHLIGSFAESGQYYWLRGTQLLITAEDDLAFVHMRVHMEVANRAGDLFQVHTQTHDRLQDDVEALGQSTAALRQDIGQLRQRVGHAIETATKAVDVSLENRQTLQKVEAALDGLETRVSVEILRLMGQDDAYAQRLERFEGKLADRLEGAAQQATDSIRAAASNAGKTMTKTVMKPAALIGAVLVVVDHLLAHPEIVGKLVMYFWG